MRRRIKVRLLAAYVVVLGLLATRAESAGAQSVDCYNTWIDCIVALATSNPCLTPGPHYCDNTCAGGKWEIIC